MNDMNKRFIATESTATKRCSNDNLFMSSSPAYIFHNCVENLTNASINNLVPNIIKFPNFFIPAQRKIGKQQFFDGRSIIYYCYHLYPVISKYKTLAQRFQKRVNYGKR